MGKGNANLATEILTSSCFELDKESMFSVLLQGPSGPA